MAPPIEGDSGWAEFWKVELVGVFSVDCGEVGPSGPSNRSSRFVLWVYYEMSMQLREKQNQVP